MNIAKKTIEHHKKIMWALVIASLVMLLFTPFRELKETVSEALPWVLSGLLVTEALFIIGIILMAVAVEHELGLNPLKWRSHVKAVLRRVPDSKVFWLGFWVNATGALGSGIVLSVGIISSLPTTSWGLVWLPFLDLGLTIALRATIIELKQETSPKKA